MEDELVFVRAGSELWSTDFGGLTMDKLKEVVDACDKGRVANTADEDRSIAAVLSALQLDLRSIGQ